MSFGLLLQRNCMCICVLNGCLCVSLCVCVCAGVCMWATKLKVCFSQQWGQNCTPFPTPSGTKATSCLCSSHMTVCVCMCMFLYVCMYTMCMLCECVYLFGLIKFWATFCYLIVFHVVAIRVWLLNFSLRSLRSPLVYPSPSLSLYQSCEMLLCCCSSSSCCCCCRAHCHRLSTRLRLLLYVVYLTTFGLTVNEANWKLPDCCEHTRTTQYGQINEFTLQYDSTQL